MAKVRVVQTPGSYRIPPPKQASRKPATPAKSPLQKTKKGGVGRPTLKKALEAQEALEREGRLHRGGHSGGCPPRPGGGLRHQSCRQAKMFD